MIVAWFLLGYLYCLVLVVGQGLVLLLSERSSRWTRLWRSSLYWGVVAGALSLASREPTLARHLVMPLVIAVVAPFQVLTSLLG